MIKKVSVNQCLDFCNQILTYEIDDELRTYFKIQKVFFYLCSKKRSECILQLTELSYLPNIYIINSDSNYLKQLFYKYLSFYYWSERDYVKVHNSFNTFRRYKYKFLNNTTNYSNDISDFYKEFSKDIYFQFLKYNLTLTNTLPN